MTDEFVYKVKKPYAYDHLRLGTPEARYQNCQDEVSLNNRLAPEVYIGVVPVVRKQDDTLALRREPKAEVVDWLVKMKRLPSDSMLDACLRSHSMMKPAKLEPVADLLASFYVSGEAVDTSAENYVQKLADTLDGCREELLTSLYNLPVLPVNAIYDHLRKFAVREQELFTVRVKGGYIVEGHGDLKPEHICLEPPVVIDCLEFDRKLRILDTIDDLTFLALECDLLGAPWIATFFLTRYQKKNRAIRTRKYFLPGIKVCEPMFVPS
ncbi:MAG: hypothetical protein R3281_00260 [Balneolaceae bacterium]|nr:hypothetical protein [Balneolaceae bacterium]